MCDRRASNVSEVAAAVAEAAVAADSSAGHADRVRSLVPSGRAEAAAQYTTPLTTGLVDGSADDLATHEANAQAGEQQTGIDTDQMAMRLALDVLWTGAAKPPVQGSGCAGSDAS